MDALDLTKTPPRGPREKLAGLVFLPRTIDKLRSEQPGGDPGVWVNPSYGMSEVMCRGIGVSMADLRQVVADAASEDDVAAWITEHVAPERITAANAQMEGANLSHVPEDFRTRVRTNHPVMASRPELTHFLDIFEADDADLAKS